MTPEKLTNVGLALLLIGLSLMPLSHFVDRVMVSSAYNHGFFRGFFIGLGIIMEAAAVALMTTAAADSRNKEKTGRRPMGGQ